MTYLRSCNTVTMLLRLSRHAPVLLAFIINASYATDIAADLHIDQVTVYPQGAMVTRSGEVHLAAGAHRLIIRGLPAGVDSSTLRVTLGAASVRLGSVAVNTVNEGQFVSDKERELRNKLEIKTDQRAALQDEIATAETQLKLLDSLASNPTGSATKAAVDGTNLTAVLNTIASSATVARSKVRDAKLRQRTLDREIETIKAELAKVATDKKQSTEVRAEVVASAAATTSVNVVYRIGDASWSWVYQARLDTTQKRLSLERQGEVRQGSGEDWQNVQLTLTTASPGDEVTSPQVVSQFLDLVTLQPMAQIQTMISAAPMLRKSSDVGSLEEKVTAAATQYLVEYQLPGRVSLSADREPRLYPITEDAFDTEIVARIVPNSSHSAYLEATFKYAREVPLEAGQLQLYRDGAFVGEAETDAFLPGAEVRMPFGVDERIRVAVRTEAAQSAQRGVINKQVIQETKQRFEITSYHAGVMPVEVIDRVPVSKNADVKVETLKDATEPTTKDLNGRAGVWLWQFAAQPQKTVAIRHYYSVRYPRDRVLQTTSEE